MRFKQKLILFLLPLVSLLVISSAASASFSVAIDPGHGGRDSGAVGPTGLREKDVNLDISMRLKVLLQSSGYGVVMTRETDTALGPDLLSDLSGRVNIANNALTNIFVSVHNNASSSPGAGGTETYFYTNPNTGWYDPYSKLLAELIQRQIVGEVGRYDRGVKTANFYVLRNSDMTAVLVEGLFISNPTEEAMLARPEVRQAIAQGIFEGIQEYVSLTIPYNWYVRRAVPGGFESISTWGALWGNSGDTPLVGNFDGDRFADIAIFRPSDASWYVKRSTGSGFVGTTSWATAWGSPGDKPLIGDFNGDGKSDIAIYRTGSYPNWFFKLSTGGGFAAQTSPLSWGNAGGDTPFVGDFNGDGKTDIGIYRTGSYPNWFFRLSPSGPTGAFSWGNAGGDTPIVGDFNGDGKTDIGVYRTGSYPNWFFLRAKPDGNGFLAPQDTWSLNWGNAGGDEPIVGDFNGDRRDDIGIFRQSGYPNWFTNNSGTYGFDIFSDTASSWGNPNTDQPIIGDFSGDGWDDTGLFRNP